MLYKTLNTGISYIKKNPTVIVGLVLLYFSRKISYTWYCRREMTPRCSAFLKSLLFAHREGGFI